MIRRNFTLSFFGQNSAFLIAPSVDEVGHGAGGRPVATRQPAPYQKAWIMRNLASFWHRSVSGYDAKVGDPAGLLAGLAYVLLIHRTSHKNIDCFLKMGRESQLE